MVTRDNKWATTNELYLKNESRKEKKIKKKEKMGVAVESANVTTSASHPPILLQVPEERSADPAGIGRQRGNGLPREAARTQG